MKLLLLGASSYVGARLYYDLKQSYSVIGTYDHTKLSQDFVRLDITDVAAVKNLISKTRPDYIVHAANNANARWCEANPALAIALNQTSTQTIVAAANDVGAKIIYISSFAAMQPTSVYGKTKLASEHIVTETRAGWVTVRPSLIVGYSPNTVNDRPFNRLLKNIDEATPAEYDTSWQFQPTWLGHISKVIDTIVQQNISNQTIPVAVPELSTRYQLACDILKPFAIHVSPVDAGDSSAPFEVDLGILTKLGLPTYNYAQIIEKIGDELAHRTRFVI